MMSDYQLINKSVSWNLRIVYFYYCSMHFTRPPLTVTAILVWKQIRLQAADLFLLCLVT